MTVTVLDDRALADAEAPIQPECSIAVDTSVYPQDAVLRACYAFTDRCWLWIAKGTDGGVAVGMRRKDPRADLDVLKGEFANALLDFALRHSIEERTRDIRATIVSAALAEATGAPPTPSRGGA
ncbi:His-Xaa-Ser system protein HxsD [Azospirillum canadense]|uniref:His-Xaa-Ser system protein HxsD n=1 Tax=Azospirillum canadense TaxID=403962 RepID=UPI0022277698|nr:His-Xaa-Ser system protein HxsD [Azospirillum canadense]MCW2243163.1 His-Xaa-Ser system protein HxsD [Azospirillum canadense]